MADAFATALLPAALLLATPALGQEPPPVDDAAQKRAMELYQNGAELYQEGRYEDAIVAFQEARKVNPHPALLFNIANAYERLAQFEEALDYLNQYRAFAPAEQRETIARRIRNLEKRLAEMAPAPAPAPAPVAAAPAPAPAPAGRGPGPALLWTGVGVGVAGGLAAGITFGASRGWIDAGNQTAWDTWRPVNNAGLVLAGVGGGLAVVGLATGGLSKSTAVQPVLGPGQVGFTGRWRF